MDERNKRGKAMRKGAPKIILEILGGHGSRTAEKKKESNTSK